MEYLFENIIIYDLVYIEQVHKCMESLPGKFLENYFRTPPLSPLSHQFVTYCKINHVAAALGPLACPSRCARSLPQTSAQDSQL